MAYYFWYSHTHLEQARRVKKRSPFEMKSKPRNRGYAIYLDPKGNPVHVTEVSTNPVPPSEIDDMLYVCAVNHPVCLVNSAGRLQQPEATQFCKLRGIPMHVDSIEDLVINSRNERVEIQPDVKNLLKGFTGPKLP